MGIDCELEKVTDIKRHADFGIMFTAALALDGSVKLSGRVPSLDKAKKLLGCPGVASCEPAIKLGRCTVSGQGAGIRPDRIPGARAEGRRSRRTARGREMQGLPYRGHPERRSE
jgi:hypothetical protein